MMERCPFCGTKLNGTNWGNKWCPNCGKIEEERSEVKDEDLSYVG